VSDFLIFLVSGLVTGAIYSLYACGLTLIYSASGIYNLAFGAFAFVAGLTFYEASTGYVPRWAAFILTVFVAAPISALILEKIVFRRLSQVPEVARLMGTIGLVVGLPAAGALTVAVLTNDVHMGLAQLQDAYSIPGIGPEPPVIYHFLGQGTLTSDELIVLVATALAVAAMWLLLTRTRMGLMTRAVVDRSVLASTRGINPASTSRVAWVLGTMLAALAGVLAGPEFGLTTDSVLEFVIAASAVVVLARFRSLPVAMFGGLGLGAISALFDGYGGKIPGVDSVLNSVPGTEASVVYLVLLIVLLVRGRERARVAGVTAMSEPVPTDYLADLPMWRQAWPWVALAVAVLLWGTGAIPWTHVQAGGLEQVLIIQALGLSIVFLSFNVVVGQLGVASLAQAAMATTGALVAGVIQGHGFLGGNFIIAVVAAGVAAAIMGVVVALPAFRLGGLALALATLALGYIADQILFQINWFSNFGNGWSMTRPILGPISFQGNKAFIVLLFLFLGGALLLVNNVRRSKTGRAIIAVRFAPAAASSSAISVRGAIVSAFAISGLLAGIGGALLAYGGGSALPSQWPTTTGLLWLMIVVVQGVRRPAAAIFGGLLATFSARVLQTGFWGIVPAVNNPTVPTILFGLTCIMLANQPDGALHQMSELNYRRRQRRRMRRASQITSGSAAPSLANGDPGTPVASVLGPTVARDAEMPGSESGVPALEVRGLVAGYRDAEVLHGVDLIVPQGSIVAVLGPNGTGKSTLCGAVAGTVSTTSGALSLLGRDVTALSAHQRVAAGMMIAPESRGIFPGLTVEENLAVLLRNVEDRSAAFERFPLLAARRKLAASNLSGGEQQMLSLAPVLVRPPRLLIADEVTLGLAPAIVREIMSLLRELRDAGVSILMVEEKASNVLELADYFAFLILGRVTSVGVMSDMTDEIVADAYLGIPSVL
jgi:ABC-type branched-subunit amino acid transport system ATPase component/branched-subunit amino acid ABC-type transport system permease component